MSLMEGYLQNGHTLYTDKWYTSIDLGRKLLDKETHLVGTLRKTRKYLPKDVINGKIKKGEFRAKENEDAQCDAGLFRNHWMLGDSAYPNRPYLLTPIINPATEAEQRYNEAHIKTRNVIERNHNLEEVPTEVELPTAEINDEVYYTGVQDVSERAALINNYFR
ncbi:unnamed protein product [Parnassius apollo]|uniref:(apollo) hypothetical protein n=1 Tax=Parnassius apollo TaxID=110799 RepID=A0A8S3XWW6_PARAO|nr:unnamed protein product [Parnassius apollo]